MYGFGEDDTQTETAITFIGRSHSGEPMVVCQWFVEVGQDIPARQPILSLKIYGRETIYKSFFPGQVKSIYCKVGQSIGLDDVLGIFVHPAKKTSTATLYTT
jgi:hypothetical protein